MFPLSIFRSHHPEIGAPTLPSIASRMSVYGLGFRGLLLLVFSFQCVDWHPSDEAVFAVSCLDDALTIWDMSVERDGTEQPQGETSVEFLSLNLSGYLNGSIIRII